MNEINMKKSKMSKEGQLIILIIALNVIGMVSVSLYFKFHNAEYTATPQEGIFVEIIKDDHRKSPYDAEIKMVTHDGFVRDVDSFQTKIDETLKEPIVLYDYVTNRDGEFERLEDIIVVFPSIDFLDFKNKED